MLSAEGTGKSIEKAIEDALAELKAPREDVDIKILSEGGLFKKARVLVTISEDAKEKYIKREKVRQEVKAEDKVETKKEVKEESHKVETPKEQNIEVKEETKVETKSNKVDKIVDPIEFLKGFFKVLNKDVEISTIEDEKYITYNVDGEDLGEVIGKRGEAFYALSTILGTVAGKTEKKVLLNIAGYREKREETLSSTARKIANKVAKSGRYYKLEPMNPSERRIIHTALQDDDRVTTLSKGTEPHRYVIIFPKEYNEKN